MFEFLVGCRNMLCCLDFGKFVIIAIPVLQFAYFLEDCLYGCLCVCFADILFLT